MNLKKTGQRLLLATIAILFMSNFLGLYGIWRLTLGAFGIGAAFVLILFGGIRPPEE
ncbi:hypothetical protein [Fusibacter sp. JL216-2]|uniref:hypothetical protein n=1 Tax=Fusibacter sp. JL216-2 TaxID=3071453 RepID=UPI003D33F8E7